MFISLTTLFKRGRAANAAQIQVYNGPVKRLRESRNVYATIELPDGMGVDDLTANKAGATMLQKIEASAGWPPGTMTVYPNMYNARFAEVILSDPRILKRPVHWEGASWTNGASIADSIS